MINLGIIGISTIFTHQFKALSELSDTYRVVAVYDPDPQKCRDLEELQTIRIHDTLDAFLSDAEIDTVAIMTPPADHTELTTKCLNSYKHVLLEKPAALHLGELEKLYALARERHQLFQVAYHASFGLDLEWFLENQESLRETYGFGPINQIRCAFYDSYTQGGAIMPEKYPLGGSFINSAVNALSVCARLTSLTPFRTVDKQFVKGCPIPAYPDGIVYRGEGRYKSSDCEIVINTAWDRGLNQKTTTLSFAGSDKSILLHHSKQSVYLAEGLKQTLLFEHTEGERLQNHYAGVYRNFAENLDIYNSDIRKVLPGYRMTMDIHRLLLL